MVSSLGKANPLGVGSSHEQPQTAALASVWDAARKAADMYVLHPMPQKPVF